MHVIPTHSSHSPIPLSLAAIPVENDWDAEIERAISAVASRFGAQVLDELRQVAQIALWRARASYRPDRGPFERYARKAVRNAIQRARTLDADPRRRSGGAASLADADVLSLPAAGGMPDDRAEADERGAAVRAWVSSQPLRVQRVYEYLFVADLTQAEAASCMGLTQARVSQLRRELLNAGKHDLLSLAA
jgi:RNA polymerase sigma factor (sigma-70 family)